MLPVISSLQMRELDRHAASEGGGFVRMQRAGMALFHKVCELLRDGEWSHPQSLRPCRRLNLPAGWMGRPVLILAGPGNNGGDGVVLAELLLQAKISYQLVLMREASAFRSEALQAWTSYAAAGGTAEVLTNTQILQNRMEQTGLVVDAMLGTGAQGPLRGIIAEVVAWLGQSGLPVLAVDSPSGSHADWTLLLGFPRPEACFAPSGDAFGQWDVADLGYDPLGALALQRSQTLWMVSPKELASRLPGRNLWAEKRGQGVLGLVAGSPGMTGAASLCAGAAMRSGAGMVHLWSVEAAIPQLSAKLTETVLHTLPDLSGFAQVHAACIGPGLSTQEEIQQLVRQLIVDIHCPLVLDADGLNACKGRTDVLRQVRVPLILTPHDGEYMRLFGVAPGEGELRVESVRTLGKEFACVIILKGAPTLIGTPSGDVYIVPVANSGLAKAGSGDLLAGIIGSFLAQGVGTTDAALLGTWVHGRAGLLAVRQLGQRGALPSDVLLQIPQALMELEACCP